MSSLRTISLTTRRVVAIATVVALSGIMVGCTDSEPAPAAGGSAPAPAATSPVDSKKPAAKEAGGKGKSMPDIPKG